MVIVTVPALFGCFQKLPYELYESLAYDVRKILRQSVSCSFQNLVRWEVLALLPNVPLCLRRLFLRQTVVSKNCVLVTLVFSVLSMQIDNVWLAHSKQVWKAAD